MNIFQYFFQIIYLIKFKTKKVDQNTYKAKFFEFSITQKLFKTSLPLKPNDLKMIEGIKTTQKYIFISFLSLKLEE